MDVSGLAALKYNNTWVKVFRLQTEFIHTKCGLLEHSYC